jgi:curved DNA-binding protein
VTIPRGIRAGQHIRLTGLGVAGLGQGKPGDLYLEIKLNPHSIYRVELHDVYLDFPVAPWEVALGAALNVPTPNGFVEIKIPAGASAGSKLRLKGRGIPSKTPGDFYAVLKIALPPADNEAAKIAYRHMSEQFKTFNPRSKLGA